MHQDWEQKDHIDEHRHGRAAALVKMFFCFFKLDAHILGEYKLKHIAGVGLKPVLYTSSMKLWSVILIFLFFPFCCESNQFDFKYEVLFSFSVLFCK